MAEPSNRFLRTVLIFCKVEMEFSVGVCVWFEGDWTGFLSLFITLCHVYFCSASEPEPGLALAVLSIV